MDSALIISYSNKVADSLAEILAQASVADITTLSNGGEARRMLIERNSTFISSIRLCLTSLGKASR